MIAMASLRGEQIRGRRPGGGGGGMAGPGGGVAFQYVLMPTMPMETRAAKTRWRFAIAQVAPSHRSAPGSDGRARGLGGSLGEEFTKFRHAASIEDAVASRRCPPGW